MNGKLSMMLVLGLLIGAALGVYCAEIFFGVGMGSLLVFLGKIFIALFLDGAMGNIALGIVIGLFSGLLISGGITAVLRRNHASRRETKKQPTYGAL